MILNNLVRGITLLIETSPDSKCILNENSEKI
jgi:hypothetical protein